MKPKKKKKLMTVQSPLSLAKTNGCCVGRVGPNPTAYISHNTNSQIQFFLGFSLFPLFPSFPHNSHFSSSEDHSSHSQPATMKRILEFLDWITEGRVFYSFFFFFWELMIQKIESIMLTNTNSVTAEIEFEGGASNFWPKCVTNKFHGWYGL